MIEIRYSLMRLSGNLRPSDGDAVSPTLFRIGQSIPGTSIHAGDDVIFDPEAPRLFTLCQGMDPGLALDQHEKGNLIPQMPAPMPADLAAAVGRLSPTHEPGDSPTLVRLK